MTFTEKELFVDIVNRLIEKSDDYNVDEHGVGITEDGEILSANGDDLEDTLKWVLEELV